MLLEPKEGSAVRASIMAIGGGDAGEKPPHIGEGQGPRRKRQHSKAAWSRIDSKALLRYRRRKGTPQPSSAQHV